MKLMTCRRGWVFHLYRSLFSSPPINVTEEQERLPQDQHETEDKTCASTSESTMDVSEVVILSDSESDEGEKHEPDDVKPEDETSTPSTPSIRRIKPVQIFITPIDVSTKKETTPSTDNNAVVPNMESDESKREPLDKNSVTPISSAKKLFSETTPKRKLTPKQLEKKLESEQKKQLKEKEREEREKQRLQEKELKEAEKQKKREQKQKEIEQKQKEIEQKRKEKEEKEEQKRQEKELKIKQKEEERLRKQQEIEEKNKEKQKEEEKKLKTAAAFVSFFVPKKVNSTDGKKLEETTSAFMPFEVKCDMKMPPPRRDPLTTDEKSNLDELVANNDKDFSYLKDLKTTKKRTCQKTWIYEDPDDDLLIVEDEVLLGETICEEKPKTERIRVKLLMFQENQRPAYYGTWRKKSKNITGRRPFGKEDIFDYTVDSDDDWEEEEQGENLEVLSDEEKENEPENDDYEVDNEFFVPHGHLSDDEVDDEEYAKLSPESQKQKLKLLKDAFDQDIKSKTQKIKPRSIGCIWYNKNGNNVDAAIISYLHPLNIIVNGRIEIKKREQNDNTVKKKRTPKPLPEDVMGILAKFVHGNTNKRGKLVTQFLNHIQTNNMGVDLTKMNVSKQVSHIAKWTWNVENKTYNWIIDEELANKYNIDYVLPTVNSNMNETV